MTLTSVLYAAGLIAVSWGAAYAGGTLRRLVAYTLFFVTPAMTVAGLMGPLTGFDRANAGGDYFGLSFLTPFLALVLLTDATRLKTSPLGLWVVGLNPIYMSSGPIPGSGRLRFRMHWRVLWRRLRIVQGDMIVGAFFISLARAFASLLSLKDSMQPLDVLLFGVVFEGFVYFNFAGYTMLAWGALRLMGVDAPRNFAMPFCSTSVVEYWKRWHISLSHVLRELFFKPWRNWLGIYGAALATFVASAVWHGVTLNFVFWGFFHGACWGTSRWLYTRHAGKWLQIPLLIFAIVVGRILFAESDTEFLAQKLAALLDLAAWRETAGVSAVWDAMTIKQVVALFVATGLVLTEHWFARRMRRQDYRHLKTPWISTWLLAGVVFFGNFGEGDAIYGQR